MTQQKSNFLDVKKKISVLITETKIDISNYKMLDKANQLIGYYQKEGEIYKNILSLLTKRTNNNVINKKTLESYQEDLVRNLETLKPRLDVIKNIIIKPPYQKAA